MSIPRLAVRAAVANLRREPSHAAELVSQLVLGEEAEALERVEGWVRVAGPDGYAGWVDAPAVAAELSAPAGALVWVRRSGLLYAGPEAGAPPLWDLVLGARAAASGIAGRAAGPLPDEVRGTDAGAGFREVALPDGGRGWAEADGWLPVAELPRRFPRRSEAVVDTALMLRGVPYLWGGTSSKAFDCSGFVQRVLALHGIRLPRDAHQQAEFGTAIDSGPAGEGLQAGDLLFFAESGSRVTHVALALGNDGRFVHSSVAGGGVGIDSLDPRDPLHARGLAATLAGARRVL